ncbi:DNA primase [Agaribacterium haliotis]|uniref:DNA primase n=1 Tax=Agaribacterium haliotis TaxID=2013869 RepID=UPI000BB54D98|nr:DNA primase [Agaribacterium haliotis]
MSRIPQNFLDDLLTRIDIVDVVDQRVKLKRSGKNYSACCPFHDEKTPSFTVSPDKQFYYCFGCGANGTAISFVMDYDRVGFVDAVDSLAKIAGVEVPREQRSEIQDAREQQRKRCYSLLVEVNDYYQQQLRQHPGRDHAVRYLQQRGLSGQIAKLYQLGYAPAGWDNLLLRFGQNESAFQLLDDCGLVVDKKEENKRYDRFRQRIMFPIRDVRGRCIGFGGRVLDDSKPKYLNSPETEVFHKSRELYGLYEARQYSKNLEQLIVVEGYMDVIALAQYGIYNAVATLGTACGEEHLKLAFRHVKDLVFCFDGDKAGRKAAERALHASLSSMEDGRQIRFLFLPEGQDPDSLVRQIGHERFGQQIEQALPLEQFLFDSAADGVDLNSLDGRARFAKNAAPMLHQLPEGIYRTLMYNNLAKRTGLATEQLLEFTELKSPEPEASREEHGETNAETRADAPELKQAPATVDYNYGGFSSEQVPAHLNDTPSEAYGAAASQHPGSNNTATARSLLELSLAKRATIVLLNHPELASESDIKLNDGDEQQADGNIDYDLKVLRDLLAYLRRRPQASFINIMGWWGGLHGAESQQLLSELVSHPLFRSAGNLSNYSAANDFAPCIKQINQSLQHQSSKSELARLNQKGLAKLSAEEKRRYQELILQSGR